MKLVILKLSLGLFLCGWLNAHASELQEVAYSTDDLHLPYPLMFTHGYNADGSSWRDRNATSQILFENMASRYGYDLVRMDKNGNLAWGYLNNYNGFGHSHDRLVARDENTNTSVKEMLKAFSAVLEKELLKATGPESASREVGKFVKEGRPFVIPVVHSTGGLVLRGYLFHNSESHRISRLVFVAVPHEGSPLGNYMHAMWRMRYDRDDSIGGLEEQLDALRELGTFRTRTSIQDGRIWRAARKLERLQTSLTFWMDGDRNSGDEDRTRDPIPGSELSLVTRLIGQSLLQPYLIKPRYSVGPNTNIMRDLGVRGTFTASYTLSGFDIVGQNSKEAEIWMDVEFPADDVQLADPATLGIPYSVVQGVEHEMPGPLPLLGNVVSAAAEHAFSHTETRPGRIKADRISKRSYGSSGLLLEGLPEGLTLDDIRDENSDGIVPAASSTAIGGDPIIEVPANHMGTTGESIAIAQAIFNDPPTFDSLYFLPSDRDNPNGSSKMVLRLRDHLFLSAKVGFKLGQQNRQHDLAILSGDGGDADVAQSHRRRLTNLLDPYEHNVELVAREVSLPFSFPAGYLHELEELTIENVQENSTQYDPLAVLTPTDLMRAINQKELDADFSATPLALLDEEDRTNDCGVRPLLTIWQWDPATLPPYASPERMNRRREPIQPMMNYLWMGHSEGHSHDEPKFNIPALANEAIVLGWSDEVVANARPYLEQMTDAIEQLIEFYGKDEVTPYTDLEDFLASAGVSPAFWDYDDIENCLGQIEDGLAELTIRLDCPLGERVIFTGALFSDEAVSNWYDPVPLLGEDETLQWGGESLTVGDYPSNSSAIPNANGATLDGIVVEPGIRLVIYSGSSFSGSVVLDTVGPAIVNNSSEYPNQPDPSNDTRTWSPAELDALYPAAVRSSRGDMHDWEDGSMKIRRQGQSLD